MMGVNRKRALPSLWLTMARVLIDAGEIQLEGQLRAFVEQM